MPKATKKPRLRKPAFKSREGTSIAVGDRIVHRMFGPGTVLGREGDKLHIKFKAAGPKVIQESFVQRA